MASRRNRADGHVFGLYCRDIMRYPVLSREEERALFARYRSTRDPAAKDRLVLSNLRFVIQEARRFRSANIPLMDLVAEGTLGLMRAVEKFDVDRDIHFISYAVWWIRQAIFDYLERMRSMVRLPASLLKRLRCAERENRNIPLGPAVPVVPTTFVPGGCGEEGREEEPLARLPADRAFDPFRVVQRILFHRQVYGLLARLPKKERKVIEMRFGLGGYHRMSLEEVSKTFRVTKERVRQIQNKALARLRHLYKAYGLGEHLSDL